RSLQEMLDACRLERGTYQRGKESAVDLGPIVERALALAAPNIASKRITLAVDQRPVAAVWGDADRLSHVVQRFVTGALRYSPKGTSVSVELTRGADRDGLGRDGVVFGIRDGGAGLTAQALGCLFTRDGGGSRPTPQGAGLGYFVARGVIEALGGEVFAENTPEGGARFGFWLPAASE
ncbi:MAG TPA: HAMP domain-containing sensor histidine kinase, partial [Byssovorax sp.]